MRKLRHGEGIVCLKFYVGIWRTWIRIQLSLPQLWNKWPKQWLKEGGATESQKMPDMSGGMWAEQKQTEVDPAEAQQVEKSVWGSVGKAMSRQSNAKYSKSKQDLKKEVPQLKQCRSLSLGWWVTPPVLMGQSQSLEGSSLSSALCSLL